jgi:two-component system response regulator AtoC
MNKILVIEDDDAVRSNVLDLLEAEGFEGLSASDGKRGIELAVQQLPDLVICDVGMAGIDGYEVFEILSTLPATAVIPFIFLSARAERADVRRGMALGADDYLTKPFTRAELLDSIRIRLKRRRSGDSQRPPAVEAATAMPSAARGTPATDGAMKALYAQVERIARGPISVLILGETGVGKEVLAERIHRLSERKGRFVPINCAALTESLLESELFGHEKGAFTGAIATKEGLFEAADGGTLFLDEVGELPPATQVKLLRVLEERKVLRVGGRVARSVDVRFISATHRDVEREAESGSFRSDLYYRLNGIALQVPPLRERKTDIAQLAREFIAMTCRASQGRRSPQLSDAALEALLAYAWPGNIRELRNVIERAVLLCDQDEIRVADLPPKMASAPPPASKPDVDPRAQLLQQIEEVERARVKDALARCGGNQTQAAELLGISRRTLVTRLAQYDLPRPRKR